MQIVVIFYAECGCPAAVAPQGSCKHIGAFSYALADFCRVWCLPEYLICTDKLQEWNKPCGKRAEPIPVDQLGARHQELNLNYHDQDAQRQFLTLEL